MGPGSRSLPPSLASELRRTGRSLGRDDRSGWVHAQARETDRGVERLVQKQNVIPGERVRVNARMRPGTHFGERPSFNGALVVARRWVPARARFRLRSQSSFGGQAARLAGMTRF